MRELTVARSLDAPVPGAVSAPSVAREDDLDFTSPEYARLYERSTATAFQHPLWLDAFFRHLAGPREAEKIVVTARDAGTGELMLALPMIRRRKSGVQLLESCDLGVSDYAAPVIARELRFGGDMGALIRAVLPAHDMLRIRPVRPEHVAAWQFCLGGEPAQLGFGAHAATLLPDFALWRQAAYEDGFRRMLDRKKKRFLKQAGAGVRLVEDPAAIRSAIAAIARLRAGRFEGDLIQQAHVEAFYGDVAAHGHAAGLARTYEIAAEGQPIGYAFGITHAARFNYLLIGCDYDTHGRHSPGLVLYDSMIEDWSANGGKIYDFTIGDEPFKAHFGTEPVPIYMIAAQPTWRGRLASAGFAARERLRRLRSEQDGD